MAGTLEVRQQHYGDEIANLEAARRGIKADISRSGSAGEPLAKARRLIVDQAAPLEFVEKSISHVRSYGVSAAKVTYRQSRWQANPSLTTLQP